MKKIFQWCFVLILTTSVFATPVRSNVGSRGIFRGTEEAKPEFTDWRFWIEAREPDVSITMETIGSVPTVFMEVSLDDGETWSPFDANGGSVVVIDQKWYRASFRCPSRQNSLSGLGGLTTNYRRFAITGRCAVGGHAISLLEDDLNRTYFPGGNANLKCLLRDNAGLEDAAELVLSALTMGTQSYLGMFYNCISLTKAPELPATTLANSCYESMFQNCMALVTAPYLGALSTATTCYGSMFAGCTSLVSVQEELPFDTAAVRSCVQMFMGCSSLKIAPDLPAMNLNSSCYYRMFNGCSSLVVPPSLPAVTLADSCYSWMFRSCQSLETAPTLPAQTLVSNCYSYMFHSSSKVKYIEVGFTDPSQLNNTYIRDWVYSVAATGDFVCPSSLGTDATITRGISAVPANWRVTNK